jgi:glycosyltransferase involved in cell wall biosynthesis
VRDRGVEVPPLLLAGSAEDGARVAAVRRIAAAAGFTDLHVVPPVVDVATLLEAARFSVLASRSEGTPNVVLEGLGLGTLVVATRVGEVADLARDGETGFTCPPDDHDALAAALLRALQLPATAAAEMGQRARADMLARFAAPIIVGQYEALYDEILSD